jgi:hypothetical protein
MKEVYESYKDKDDGFLYILVKDENVFGWLCLFFIILYNM